VGQLVELLGHGWAKSLPLIWLPGPSPAHDELRAARGRIGATPRQFIEAHDPIVALQLVKAGVGVSLVQTSLRRMAPKGVRFVALPPRFPLKLEVYRALSAHVGSAIATGQAPHRGLTRHL
jgi:DNA-binding transcriptional LysR family regulator